MLGNSVIIPLIVDIRCEHFSHFSHLCSRYFEVLSKTHQNDIWAIIHCGSHALCSVHKMELLIIEARMLVIPSRVFESYTLCFGWVVCINLDPIRDMPIALLVGFKSDNYRIWTSWFNEASLEKLTWISMDNMWIVILKERRLGTIPSNTVKFC